MAGSYTGRTLQHDLRVSLLNGAEFSMRLSTTFSFESAYPLGFEALGEISGDLNSDEYFQKYAEIIEQNGGRDEFHRGENAFKQVFESEMNQRIEGYLNGLGLAAEDTQALLQTLDTGETPAHQGLKEVLNRDALDLAGALVEQHLTAENGYDDTIVESVTRWNNDIFADEVECEMPVAAAQAADLQRPEHSI